MKTYNNYLKGIDMGKTEFDKIIKELSGISESSFGYVNQENKSYDNYITNTEFEKFMEDMHINYSNAYDSYFNGNGGELKEKKGRYGWYPPKMASIASSSRFIYLTMRDDYKDVIKKLSERDLADGKFKFEDELVIPNKDGTGASLDASYKEEKTAIYIEAKCHELFDTHKLEWKDEYFKEGLFFGNDKKSLQLNITDCDGNSIHRKVFKLDNDTLYLDVKQFVCHLLGIANDGDFRHRELIYLYFKPDHDKLKIFENKYNILEKQFKNFAESKCIKKFCVRNNITLKLAYATNIKMGEDTNIVIKYK